jgi:hypothetical protein
MTKVLNGSAVLIQAHSLLKSLGETTRGCSSHSMVPTGNKQLRTHRDSLPPCYGIQLQLLLSYQSVTTAIDWRSHFQPVYIKGPNIEVVQEAAWY